VSHTRICRHTDNTLHWDDDNEHQVVLRAIVMIAKGSNNDGARHPNLYAKGPVLPIACSGQQRVQSLEAHTMRRGMVAL
jgi:hypothetical protein